MPADTPDLSVIIVNWNTRELLRECLQSIGRDQDQDQESAIGSVLL